MWLLMRAITSVAIWLMKITHFQYYTVRGALANDENPRMHFPQHIIHNRNVHLHILNGVLWDMEQGISEISL